MSTSETLVMAELIRIINVSMGKTDKVLQTAEAKAQKILASYASLLQVTAAYEGKVPEKVVSKETVKKIIKKKKK